MMAAKREKTGFRGFGRRWGALIAVCLILAILAAVDYHIKHADPGIGFYPPGASCVILSSDFPAFCADLAATETADRFLAETPRPFDAFELAVRKTTGVRPTPLRWRVWLGPRLLYARWNGTHGICAHPGLLVRVAHSLRTLADAGSDADGVYTYAEHFYAWRNGYLLVSPSREYVMAALDAPPSDPPMQGKPNDLWVRWKDGAFKVSPETNVPVSGTLNIALSATGNPLVLSEAWPDTTLISLTTHTPGDAAAIWQTARFPIENMPIYSRLAPLAASVWEQWALDSPGEDWARRVDECSFALTGINTTATLPIPEWGVMLRASSTDRMSDHPWETAIAPLAPIEYAWEGRPGLVATLLGEEMAVCLANDGGLWLAASQQHLMNDLLATTEPGHQTQADAILEIDWHTAGKTAENLVRMAGEWELVSEMNAQEADAFLGKYARSVARMGRLRILAHAQDSGVDFQGSLASPEDVEGNRP